MWEITNSLTILCHTALTSYHQNVTESATYVTGLPLRNHRRYYFEAKPEASKTISIQDEFLEITRANLRSQARCRLLSS
jgi:hypothetical protein